MSTRYSTWFNPKSPFKSNENAKKSKHEMKWFDIISRDTGGEILRLKRNRDEKGTEWKWSTSPLSLSPKWLRVGVKMQHLVPLSPRVSGYPEGRKMNNRCMRYGWQVWKGGGEMEFLQGARSTNCDITACEDWHKERRQEREREREREISLPGEPKDIMWNGEHPSSP